MSDFNVFDEWGNRVGKFTPTGSGCGDSIAMAFALMFLWTIGFVIYALIWLITNGIKSIAEGKLTRGMAFLIIPGTLVFLALFGFASNMNDYHTDHQNAIEDLFYISVRQVEVVNEYSIRVEVSNRSDGRVYVSNVNSWSDIVDPGETRNIVIKTARLEEGRCMPLTIHPAGTKSGGFTLCKNVE